MKKLIFAILIIGVLMLAACSNEGQKAEDETQNVDVSSADSQAADRQKAADGTQDTENSYVLQIRDWVIEPATINLQAGNEATLTVIDDNQEFAFTIPGIEIEEITQRAASVDLIFTPEEPGTYNLVCVAGCPAGTEFDGLIIVE